jgi:predicted aspartyl protease
MARTVFRYAPLRPPAPAVLVELSNYISTNGGIELSAIVDTGADQTVIPQEHLDTIDAMPHGTAKVLTFDDRVSYLSFYQVRVLIRGHPPHILTVLASDAIQNMILGRDLLNQYQLILHGPQQKLEVIGVA